MVNIKGLDKAEVLLALWKGSHCQGLSFLALASKGVFTIYDAKNLIEEQMFYEWRRTKEWGENMPYGVAELDVLVQTLEQTIDAVVYRPVDLSP